MRSARFVALVLGAAALAGVSTACVSTASISREPHSGTGTASEIAAERIQQITITTGPDYRFHPSTIVVHPGKVRVVLVNTGQKHNSALHDWSLSGFPGAFVPQIGGGLRASTTFIAPAPGRYQFVCTIHTREGQTGTLVVESG